MPALETDSSKPNTSQPKTPERIRASHPVRILRAATLAMILIALGAWLGFC